MSIRKWEKNIKIEKKLKVNEIFKKFSSGFRELTEIKEKDGNFLYTVKSLIIRFSEHNVSQTGGQIAYFFLLSIFPFVVFVNSLIGYMNFSKEEVVRSLSEIFPVQVAEVMGEYVEYVSEIGNNTGVISVAVLITLFSASKSIRALSVSVNRAYGIKKKRKFIVSVVLSMVLTFMLGITIVASLAIVSVGRKWLYRIVIMSDIPLKMLDGISTGRWIVVFGIFLVTLILIYYTVPIKKVKLKSVLPGAFAAVAANFLLTYGYSVYVYYFDNYSMLYGSLGVILLLALWLYLVGIFIIMGAELNSILEEGRKIM